MDEVSHDMSLQMVHVDERNLERGSHSLGKGNAHEERDQEARATREGNGRELLPPDTGTLQRLVHHGYDVLLVGTTGQLGHHTAVGLMHGLAGRHVAEQDAVSHYGCRRIVAAALDSQYICILHACHVLSFNSVSEDSRRRCVLRRAERAGFRSGVPPKIWWSAASDLVECHQTAGGLPPTAEPRGGGISERAPRRRSPSSRTCAPTVHSWSRLR